VKFSLILNTSSKNPTQGVIPKHRCSTEYNEEDEQENQDEPSSIEDWSYVHDPPWWAADLNGSFRLFSLGSSSLWLVPHRLAGKASARQ